MSHYRTARINIFLTFSLLVFLGCEPKSSMISQKGREEVDPAPMKISKVNTLDWRVGPEHKQKISRGISVLVDLPQLEADDLKKLIADRRVDAWLVQLHRRGTTGMEVLARTAVPLTGYKSQMKAISFPIQYAASALSMRRAEMRCPSFDHRYVIGDIKVEESAGQGLSKLIVGPSQNEPQRGKFNLFQVRPESINGGHRLQGDYRVEIALFNREKKRMRSNFVTYPELVKVRSEKKITIEGCDSYKEKNNSSVNQSDFEFGR